MQSVRRGCGDSAAGSRARSADSRAVSPEKPRVHRAVRAALREAALLRRVRRLRGAGRLADPVVLRRDVLDADAAGVPAKRLRHRDCQVPDQNRKRARLPAVRGHPSRERRLEEPLHEARVQEELPDGPSHFAAAWDVQRRRAGRRDERRELSPGPS